MLDEKKLGLVPRIIVQGKLGPKEYAIMVTDKRSIFVLESSSKAGIAGALGGAIGAAVAAAATSRRTFDYESSDPDVLAADQKNFVIMHPALDRFEVKKAMLGPIYRFTIEYKNEEGKGKKVKGQLVLPSALSRQRKQEGASRGVANRDYAGKVRELYGRALPATAVTTVLDWNL